jgi:hypothetical protein
MYRSKVRKNKSVRSFSRGATRTHVMNVKPRAMRGGIRL